MKTQQLLQQAVAQPHSQQAQEAGEPAWFIEFVRLREISDKLAKEEADTRHAASLAMLQSKFHTTLNAHQNEINELKKRSVPSSTKSSVVPSQPVGEYVYVCLFIF